MTVYERLDLLFEQNNGILKGGMLVAAMVGLDARSTMDIDATVGCGISSPRISSCKR